MISKSLISFCLIVILAIHMSFIPKQQSKYRNGDLYKISMSKMRKHLKSSLSENYTCLEYFKKRRHYKENLSYFQEILNVSLISASFDSITLKEKDTFCIIITTQIASEWNYITLIHNDLVINLERDSLRGDMKIINQYKDTIKDDAYFFKRGMLDNIPRVLFYGGDSGMRLIKTEKKVKTLFHNW
jgi:hypothetical protein